MTAEKVNSWLARAADLLAEAGLDVDYVALAPFHPPVLAAAVRIGGTRLIDNALVTGGDTT